MSKEKFFEKIDKYYNSIRYLHRNFDKEYLSENCEIEFENFLKDYSIVLFSLFFSNSDIDGCGIYLYNREWEKIGHYTPGKRWLLLNLKKTTREQIYDTIRKAESIPIPKFINKCWIDEYVYRAGDILIQDIYGEDGVLEDMICYTDLDKHISQLT